MRNSVNVFKLGALAITASSAACILALPTNTVAAASSAVESAQTQDVIQMRDGRVLTGTIVEETATQIVFRYVDPNINIQTQIRLNKADVLNIDRGVVLEAEVQQPQQEDFESDTVAPDWSEHRTRGLAEGDADDESLPSLYVIPMKGQMGTDIYSDVYRQIISDIRKQQPDKVVWVLESADFEDLLIPRTPCTERGLAPNPCSPCAPPQIQTIISEYRDLVRALQDELRGIDQVMWVHDAVGVSAVIALAWPEMYMTPTARLAGMSLFHRGGMGDTDYIAKMREAFHGIGNGFVERGNRSIVLGLAMMDPERVLSASWRGREVEWRNDLSGEYVVNAATCRPATFRAKAAEDFGISSGTAETLDDLAMLLGYREYRLIEGDAQRTINNYVHNWRRAFDSTLTWIRDYQQHLGWANGDQTLMYLGRAKNDLERILQAMNRYRAVEIRFQMETGLSKLGLETMIEQLNEQIRALREAQRNCGRSGGGRGRGGCGGGRCR